MNRSIVRLLLTYLLGSLFLYTGLTKAANPTVFLGSVYAYSLPLPESFLKATAVMMPWVEILCGLLLVTRPRSMASLTFAIYLLAVFVVITGQAFARGLHIGCGCFDPAVLTHLGLPAGLATFAESLGFAFFRNIGLIALASWLLLELEAPASQSQSTPQRQPEFQRKTAPQKQGGPRKQRA